MSSVHSKGRVLCRVDSDRVVSVSLLLSSSLQVLVGWWYGLSVGGAGNGLRLRRVLLLVASFHSEGGVLGRVDSDRVVLASSLLLSSSQVWIVAGVVWAMSVCKDA
jgi:hypothetical protein